MIKNLRYLCTFLLLWVAGVGLAQDVVEIGTVDQLKTFRDAVNSGTTYAGKTVKLTADLDLSGESNWTPIGNLVSYPGQSFNGTFDGDGHTISNLTVNDNTPNYAVAGLFGSVVNGTIKNLTVKNVNITSTHYAAGIVAYTSNGPTIENCKVIGGTIKSTPEIVNGSYDNGDKAGGIMGYATAGSTINNCTVEGVTISGYRDLGGIVGYSNGSVTNNTVENVTVTQDPTNGYKNPTPTTVGDIVGGGSATNNVEANDNKVIKSDPVAQIGETKYETIADAVKAAKANDVIEIIKAGDYTLPNLSKNVTIEGKADGVVSFTHTTAGSIASIPNGATFKNVTFNFGNVNYHGFQHAGTINMEGCTLNGKLFSYGDMNFTDCSFNQSNSDYHMWTYSGNVTYTNCTFTNSVTGKFLNVYNESGATKYTVTVNDCKFVNNASAANKAALNVKATSDSNVLAYDVIINNCTTEGAFPKASESQALVVLNNLVQVDDRTADGVDNITITQDSKKIYPLNYVAQIGETKYETLAEAVAAAKSGDTIKLLADLENTGNVSLPAGVTLDGDGKNITGTSAVYINKDGGTVQNVNFKNIHNSSNKQSAIYGSGLVGTATITGCTFDNCDWDAIQITPVAGANVVITNNMFSDDVTDNVKQQRYIHVQSKTNVDFSATITENVMPGKLTQEPIGVYYPRDKAKIDLTKNYIESINDVCILVADNNGYAGELVFPAYTTAEKQETYSPVAMIQNGNYAANFYAKLQDAIDAGEGKTVKLLADIDLGNNAASINKAVTINGDGHTITSTATQAVAISGAGNVTINNTVISAKNRGINVLDVNTGFTLDVVNSTIQSQVSDPTTTYTTGNDSRGINVANADGVTVNITNSTIQGFSYDINIPGTGKNLIVNVTGGKTYGRDIVNNWGSNNTFNLNGVEVHGLNNQTGPTEAFSCIVDNEVCQKNNYIIQDCQFIATLSEDAMGAEGSSATEQMIDLRGTNSVATVKGNTTYTINEGAETRGGIVTTEVYLMSNKGNIVRFDDTAKQNFVSWAEKLDAFDFANKDDENYWPLTFVAQVQLVYPEGGKYYGKNLKTIKSAFEDEKYGDKTQITLLKDITLDENLTCPLTDGQYFIMNMSDYAVTKGDYSIALVPGTTVYSTKQTDIFSSANADFKVVETEEDGGFAYTVVAKVYVAQVGEGESAVKYESLEKALEAISTVTTVNHPKSGLTINQYKANGTVTLLADCEGNGIVIDSGSELTIDFAGHTYSVTGDLVGSDQTEYNGFQLLQNSNVTFKSTAEEPGVINSSKAIFLVQNYSNLTLENMTLDGSNLSGRGAYTLSNNNGNIVINNSTITAKEGTGNFAFDVCRYSSYPSVNVTVKGDSKINGDVEVSASGNDAKDGFKLMLEAGTMTGEIVLDASAKAAMAAAPEKALVMKSESFTKDAPADYKWVAAEDGTLKLVPCEYVAQVGEGEDAVKYESLEKALEAISTVTTVNHPKSGLTINQYKANGTVTLLADCEGNGIVIDSGSELTIDFAGHTYSVTGDLVGSDQTEYNGFQLLQNSNVTFKSTAEEPGVINSSKAIFLVQNYSNLTLENMTLDGSNLSGRGAYTLSNNNGNIVINNSTITAKEGTGNFAFDVCRYSSYPSVNVTVKGDSKINGDVEVSASGSDAKDGFSLMLENCTLNGEIVLDATAKAAMAATPEKATVSKSNTLTAIAAPAGYKWVDNGDETSTLKPCEYVAQIGETGYETLDAAFEAAEAGAIVKVLTAITLDKAATLPAGKTVTLDLNGKTISAATNTIRNMGNLTVVDNAGNGKIVSTGNFAISVGNNSTTTISNAESKDFAIESVEGAIITGTVTGATINIKGGTLSASDNAVVAGNGSAGFGGNTINITGGTFNGGITSTGYVACGIYAPNNDVWNITGGTFNITGGAGVVQRAGTVNISDGVVFNVTGTATGMVGDSRVVVPCAAIVFDSQAAYPGMTDASSMNVSGGTFNAAVDAVASIANEGAATHIAISGGKFTSQVPENCCAPNYIPTTEAVEGYYTVQTKEEAGIFELIDGEVIPIKEPVQATKVTYKRTFKSTQVGDLKYQAWYVPFDYTITEKDAENFQFYKIHMISASTTTGVIEDAGKVFINILKMKEGDVLRANRAYMVTLKTAGTYEFKAENVTVSAEPVTPTSFKHLETSDFAYDFYGTYVGIGAEGEREWMAMNGGLICWNKDATAKLGSYRWYIKITPKDNSDAKPNIIIIEGDGDTDGISNAQVIYDEIEGIYTLGGMKVEHPVKGVNIIKYTDGRTRKINVK